MLNAKAGFLTIGFLVVILSTSTLLAKEQPGGKDDPVFKEYVKSLHWEAGGVIQAISVDKSGVVHIRTETDHDIIGSGSDVIRDAKPAALGDLKKNDVIVFLINYSAAPMARNLLVAYSPDEYQKLLKLPKEKAQNQNPQQPVLKPPTMESSLPKEKGVVPLPLHAGNTREVVGKLEVLYWPMVEGGGGPSYQIGSQYAEMDPAKITSDQASNFHGKRVRASGRLTQAGKYEVLIVEKLELVK